jgi:Cephalosporin hydroxylase
MQPPKMPPKMLQHEQEFAEFLTVIRDLGVTSYLEIGAKFGGSLYRVGQVLPKGSFMMAVDLPAGTQHWSESEISLRAVAAELNKQGRQCSLIFGDSTDPKIINQVNSLGGKFDFVLIDANHTLTYVRRDFFNYGPLAKKAIAFHDISWRRPPEWKGTPIHVPQFWDETKDQYRYQEIRHDPTGRDNGFGILFV